MYVPGLERLGAIEVESRNDQRSGAQQAQPSGERASWLPDHLPKPAPVTFTERPSRARVLLFGLAGALTVTAGLILAGLVLPAVVVAITAVAATFLAELQLVRSLPEWRAKHERRIELSTRERPSARGPSA